MTNKTNPIYPSKFHKITYWVSTLWLSLGMLSTGIVQLIKMKEESEMMTHLGYPIYGSSVKVGE